MLKVKATVLSVEAKIPTLLSSPEPVKVREQDGDRSELRPQAPRWKLGGGIEPTGELARIADLGMGHTGTAFDPSLAVSDGTSAAMIVPLRLDAFNMGKDSDIVLTKLTPSGSRTVLAKIEHGSATATDGRYVYVLQRPHGQEPGAILRFDPLGTDCPPEGQLIFKSKALPDDPGMAIVPGKQPGDPAGILLVGSRTSADIRWVDPKTQHLTTVGTLPKTLSHPTVVLTDHGGEPGVLVVGGLDPAAKPIPQASPEVLAYRLGAHGLELKQRLMMTDGAHPTGAAGPSVVPLPDGELWVSGGWQPSLSSAGSAPRQEHTIVVSDAGIALKNGAPVALPDSSAAPFGPSSSAGLLGQSLVFHRGFEMGRLKLPVPSCEAHKPTTLSALHAYFRGIDERAAEVSTASLEALISDLVDARRSMEELAAQLGIPPDPHWY
ncbi:MAG: hypothetical protein U1E65_19910 [Myxococcota bacterium]